VALPEPFVSAGPPAMSLMGRYPVRGGLLRGQGEMVEGRQWQTRGPGFPTAPAIKKRALGSHRLPELLSRDNPEYVKREPDAEENEYPGGNRMCLHEVAYPLRDRVAGSYGLEGDYLAHQQKDSSHQEEDIYYAHRSIIGSLRVLWGGRGRFLHHCEAPGLHVRVRSGRYGPRLTSETVACTLEETARIPGTTTAAPATHTTRAHFGRG
jgi:hypothetical protein